MICNKIHAPCFFLTFHAYKTHLDSWDAACAVNYASCWADMAHTYFTTRDENSKALALKIQSNSMHFLSKLKRIW